MKHYNYRVKLEEETQNHLQVAFNDEAKGEAMDQSLSQKYVCDIQSI